MKKPNLPALFLCMLVPGTSMASEDPRELVEFPQMMQDHMLSNMRDHLAAIDEILAALADGQGDHAAEIAEHRLGMSSLQQHGAQHMAKRMAPGMRQLGSDMHRAASDFALVAQEGDNIAAYAKLQKVTAACVACHAAYRIR